MGAKIEMIEYYFPGIVLTNEDLKCEFPDTDFSKFEEKIGIKERYISSKDETALDLAYNACEKLLKRYDKDKIDYLLYCTQSPEFILPTSACILQDRLGLSTTVGAFDFNLGCSGFTYGISIAKSLIDSKQARNILLVTAETYSKYLHAGDKSNRAIFGDAASACLISFSEENGIFNFLSGTDGSGYNNLIIKNGASRFPKTENENTLVYGNGNLYSDNHIYMDGPAIFNFTTEVIPKFVNKVMDVNSIDKVNVNQFILHQANAFMLNTIRKSMLIEKDKFFIDLVFGGNTVSSTIPIALKKYAQIYDGQDLKVVLIGFGVGLSWSGGLIKIDSKL
jgi:3-oxoacyl-[acyl-carrier-protein] synthase-3